MVGGVCYLCGQTFPQYYAMKPTYLTILAGGLVVALSLAVNLRLARSHHRALENIEALSEENAHLRCHISTLADSLATHHLSVPRQRLSRGELREFHPEEYDAIRGLGVRPRRVESIASVVSITGLDLLLEHDTMAVATIHDTLRPLVWHDGWVGVTLTPHPEGVARRIARHILGCTLRNNPTPSSPSKMREEANTSHVQSTKGKVKELDLCTPPTLLSP